MRTLQDMLSEVDSVVGQFVETKYREQFMSAVRLEEPENAFHVALFAYVFSLSLSRKIHTHSPAHLQILLSGIFMDSKTNGKLLLRMCVYSTLGIRWWYYRSVTCRT